MAEMIGKVEVKIEVKGELPRRDGGLFTGDDLHLRQRIFWVDVHQFLAIMGLLATSAKSVRPVCRNLPVNADVVAVHFDYQRNAFAVIVRHWSFDPVPPGEPIPWLDRLDVEVQHEASREELYEALAEVRSEDVIRSIRETFENPISKVPLKESEPSHVRIQGGWLVDGQPFDGHFGAKPIEVEPELNQAVEHAFVRTVEPGEEFPNPVADPRPPSRGGWF